MSRLSPIDIQHAEFSRRAGGYDRREVKAFLERVALEVEEALRGAQQLRRRLEEAEAETKRLEEAEADLQQVVLAAERIAAELKESARREAEAVLKEAEAQRAARLGGVEAELIAANAELERLRRERRLFREQFRAMLSAYATSLDATEELAEAPLQGAQSRPEAARAGVAARSPAAKFDTAEGALLDDTVEP